MAAAWTNRAYGLLSASMGNPPHELNELDWKADLSGKGSRVAEHVAAFANYPGGGHFVFGITDSCEVIGVTNDQIEAILNKLSNVGRQGLEPVVSIDHAVVEFEGKPVLIVRVPESSTKPVHAKGRAIDETFVRSGGTTRKASRQEVGNLLLNSRTPRWEDLHASPLMEVDQVRAALDFSSIFEALERPQPRDSDELWSWAVAEGFVIGNVEDGFYITNLGAISLAKRLQNFPSLSRKAARVIVYNGNDKTQLKLEIEGSKGYAVGFKGLLDFVMSQLPQSEVIERAFRVKRTVYPELALRELIANALIHQDFMIGGSGPMIEIYADRITITNPGTLLPSKRLDRLIGTQPESRNETLARAYRRYKICEELGSGLVKVGLQSEMWGLPPIKFETGDNYFRVTLFSPRTYAEMSQAERLAACYQHAVLRHVSNGTMTNKSLRERLKVAEKNRSMISTLIQQALEKNLIKAADPENTSRKFTEYVPIWA